MDTCSLQIISQTQSTNERLLKNIYVYLLDIHIQEYNRNQGSRTTSIYSLVIIW